MSNSQNEKNEQQNNLCTTLTEQWKKGELEVLDKLIKQIEAINNNRALPDEYLRQRGIYTREDYNIAGEWGYGIVWVIVDYVLPYLKQVQQLKELLLQIRNRQSLIREYLSDVKLGNAWDLLYQTENEITKAIGEKK